MANKNLLLSLLATLLVSSLFFFHNERHLEKLTVEIESANPRAKVELVLVNSRGEKANPQTITIENGPNFTERLKVFIFRLEHRERFSSLVLTKSSGSKFKRVCAESLRTHCWNVTDSDTLRVDNLSQSLDPLGDTFRPLRIMIFAIVFFGLVYLLLSRTPPPDRFYLVALGLSPFLVFFKILFLPNRYTLASYQDNLYNIFATYHFYLDTLRSFRWPFWDPYRFAGTPYLFDPLFSALYPVNYLLLPVYFIQNDVYLFLIVSCVFHSAIAALGMYAWLRELSLPRPASFLGGFLYAWGAVISTRFFAQTQIAWSFCWLPLLLFLYLRSVRNPNRFNRDQGATSLVFATTIMAGQHYTFLLNAVVLAALTVWLVFQKSENVSVKKIVVNGVTVLTSTIGLSLVFILPSVEYAAHAYRFINSPDLPVVALATLNFSTATHHIATWDYIVSFFRRYPGQDLTTNLYLGALSVVFVAVGIFRKFPTKKLWLTLGLFFTLGSLGPPYFISKLLNLVPLLDKIRTLDLYLYPVYFCLVVFTVYGFDRICGSAKRWSAAVILVMVANVAFFANRQVIHRDYPSDPGFFRAHETEFALLRREQGFRRIMAPLDALGRNWGEIYQLNNAQGNAALVLQKFWDTRALRSATIPDRPAFNQIPVGFYVTESAMTEPDFDLRARINNRYIYQNTAAVPAYYWTPDVRNDVKLAITEVRENTNSVYVDLVSASDGFLVTPITAYPAWRATVNGEAVAWIPVANRLAVPLRRGQASVTLEFRPRKFYLGAFSSLVTLLLLAPALFRKFSIPCKRTEYS